jgi:hypothetical protein
MLRVFYTASGLLLITLLKFSAQLGEKAEMLRVLGCVTLDLLYMAQEKTDTISVIEIIPYIIIQIPSQLAITTPSYTSSIICLTPPMTQAGNVGPAPTPQHMAAQTTTRATEKVRKSTRLVSIPYH